MKLIKVFFAALVEAQERRARRAALERLDAHLLRDIGLEEEAHRARRRVSRERFDLSPYYYQPRP